MQFQDQAQYEDKKKEVGLLLYLYLPSGLITFVLQIVDDFLVAEDHIGDGLVMVRNLFELIPVIILIWVFKGKPRTKMTLDDTDI